MRVLYVKYSLWKSVVLAGGLDVYEKVLTGTQAQAWAGKLDITYRTDIEDTNYADYTSAFSTRTAVVDEDEALAHIIGLATTLDPRTSDGRSIFLPSRYRGDVDPYFAGCDDDGNLFEINWVSAPGVAERKEMVFSFADWLYISKGTIRFRNAGLGDYMDFKVRAPASVATVNGTNEGNCNLVDLGGYKLIVPAAGDGTHDIAEAAKVPLPASAADGYWDWDMPDTGRGTLSPGSPGAAQYNLLDIPVDLVRWVKKIPILGDGTDPLHPETKARRLLPHWELVVGVHNESLSTIHVVWHLDCARKKTAA